MLKEGGEDLKTTENYRFDFTDRVHNAFAVLAFSFQPPLQSWPRPLSQETE